MAAAIPAWDRPRMQGNGADAWEEQESVQGLVAVDRWLVQTRQPSLFRCAPADDGMERGAKPLPTPNKFVFSPIRE
jgi:hypothetical protein